MSSAQHELLIEAGRTESQYWRDLFRYRELFYFLAWRDVLVRYKQTVIGVLWAVIRPFLTMVVFVFVFSRIAKLPASSSSCTHLTALLHHGRELFPSRSKVAVANPRRSL